MSKVVSLRPDQPPTGYRVVARAASRAEIYLYGVIGRSLFEDGVSARRFADDLKALGNVNAIDVRINSDGGSVFEGRSMFSMLNQHPARIVVHVDGVAASIASLIAMAGDEIRMADGAFLMIHNSSALHVGDANEMRRMADLLEAVDSTLKTTYAARSRQPLATIAKWMAAETWMNAAEAVDRGFADSVVEGLRVAAQLHHRERFRNLPGVLQRAPVADPTRPNRARAEALIARMRRRPNGPIGA